MPKDIKNMPQHSKTLTDDKTPSCYADTQGIITTTTDEMPGYKVTKMLGTVYGLTVRTRNWGVDMGAFLKSSTGGELAMFTKLMYVARNEAMDRMVGECMGRGGNAILAVRMDVTADGIWSSICAYGTACVIAKIDEDGKGDGEKKYEGTPIQSAS